MQEPLKVFIGFDSREPVAYHVLAHSILRHASVPVTIQPVALHQVQDVYMRPRGALESTEFSMTRFLVPYLCNYRGVALFLDCDMLFTSDVLKLMSYAIFHPEKAVHVCQHAYTPKDTTKFLGATQTTYPRKNWSSVMVFNNERCRALRPEYVNTATGLQLHRFQWLADSQIGALPLEWNWLVGEYEKNPLAYNYHYTLGGPYFPQYADCDHADLWWQEYARMAAPMTPALSGLIGVG